LKFLILFFSVIILFNYTACENSSGNNNKAIQKDSVVTAKLLFVGDLMCHAPQFQYAKVSGDSFDFNLTYQFIDEIISQADFAAANLETVTAGKEKKYSGYPLFNSPDDFVEALKNTGFDLMFTSNNHSLDRGEFGVKRTIEILNKNKLNYVGTNSSQRDKDSIRIFNINGIKIAFLSYSYSANGNYIAKNYLLNLIDSSQIKNDLQKAKQFQNDLTIVYFHFGNEYQREPNKQQKSLVNFALNNGADIIIASHPHVIQPIEIIPNQNSKLKKSFVAYSLGNFISNQRERFTDSGVILNLEISKMNNDSIFIKNYNFIPTYVYKGIYQNKKSYLIIPETIDSAKINFLSKSEKEKMLQRFEDTKSIITKYNSKN